MNQENYGADPESLMRILKRLRAPGGCPWDRKQTRESLSRHLDEECGELLEALASEPAEHICEELGDVLMNLFFQIVVAEERGEFTYADVWRMIVDKMIRRHVHIFGSAHADTPEEVAALWQQVKAEEHPQNAAASVLDGVKTSANPLPRAEAVQRKAAEVGFDWPGEAEILDKIREETAEAAAALASGNAEAADEELGDLLFAVVNLIRFRHRRSSAELMREATGKFERRFRKMEALLQQRQLDFEQVSPAQLDSLWEQVKAEEKATDA